MEYVITAELIKDRIGGDVLDLEGKTIRVINWNDNKVLVNVPCAGELLFGKEDLRKLARLL
jgi:hypothetical protein